MNTIVVLLLVLGAACARRSGDLAGGITSPLEGYDVSEDGVAGAPSENIVVHGRLDVFGSHDGTVRVVDHPFSHRDRKWHVYQLSLEAGSEVELTAVNDDVSVPASMWVHGPQRPDGSWGEGRHVSLAPRGRARVRADHYGEYAIVVGPTTPSGFLPRVSSDVAVARIGDREREITFETRANETWARTRDGAEWRVVHAPRSPTVGALIELEHATGGRFTTNAIRWIPRASVVEDVATTVEQSVPATVRNNVIELERAGELERFLVVQAFGADGTESTSPLVYKIVPEQLLGRRVEIVEDRACSTPPCRAAVFAENGQRVHEDFHRFVRRSSFDADERNAYAAGRGSTYDLTARCVMNCGDHARSRTAYLLPRHPVYFAHGFNANAAAWNEVRRTVETLDPAIRNYSGASDLQALDSVERRAEALRHDLERFVRTYTPVEGEEFVRVNIIAHSIAGLDARVLVSDAKYNERCTELLCRSETGSYEACCARDANGVPIRWRDRIVSLTTLSTPHAGTSFADATLRSLDGEWDGTRLDATVDRVFSLATETEIGAGRRTILNLSRPFVQRSLATRLMLPDAARRYDWSCAIGASACRTALPTGEAAPGFLGTLPGPTAVTTVFSWSSRSCVSGLCGDAIDPKLFASASVVRANEDDNDGVASVESARYGIYMGARAGDHFSWGDPPASMMVRRTGDYLFGVARAPAGQFHVSWLRELVQAGY